MKYKKIFFATRQNTNTDTNIGSKFGVAVTVKAGESFHGGCILVLRDCETMKFDASGGHR